MTTRYGISIYSRVSDLAIRAGLDAIGLMGATYEDDFGISGSHMEAVTKPLIDTQEEVQENFSKRHPGVEIRVWPIG